MTRSPNHLLVVDDDDRIRDLVKRYLTNIGYHVTTASGGEAARKLLDQLVFDLIILDIMMPDINGNEVLRRIRERFSEIELPVIMVTLAMPYT